MLNYSTINTNSSSANRTKTINPNSRLYSLSCNLLTFLCAVFITLGSSAQERQIHNYDVIPVDPDQLVVEPVKGATTNAAGFVEMGKPTGGYNTICHMIVFNSKLFLATSANPLASYGAAVFSTTNGSTFTSVLSDATSQGYLRMREFDSKLWIPDGDPNGLDPGYCYISSTGASGSFNKTSILQAVHTFDVIKYKNKMLVSNGMSNSQGGICKYNGTNQWSLVYQSSASFRMKYMVEFNGKLLVANRNPNSDVDYFFWNGDVETTTPTQKNVISGAAGTYRWYASSLGKLFWCSAAGGQLNCKVSTDGSTWSTVTSLNGKFISAFEELNGKLYALSHDGLWESSDFSTFTLIAPTPAADPNTFKPVSVPGGSNADGMASMVAFNGALYCGSSTNGKLYKVDVTTAVQETPVLNIHHYTTNHSVIVQSANKTNASIKVFDLTGALILSVASEQGSAQRHEFDLTELRSGFYLIQLMAGTEVKGIKFVRK